MATNPQITDGTTTIKFVTLKRSDPAPPGELTENVTRPGVDGTALRKRGTRGTGYRLVGQADVASNVDRRSLLENAALLKGQIVTVTDDHLEDWTDVVIQDVRPQSSNAMGTPVGGLKAGTGTIMVTIEFDCLDTRTSP